MNLRPFKDKFHKGIPFSNRTIIIFAITILGLLTLTLYQSYALYKQTISYNIINGVVGTFSSADIKLAVFVDGETTNEFPAPNNGYVFDKLECTNSGVASFNKSSWKLFVADISDPTECKIYFIEQATFKDKIIADVIAKDQIKSDTPNFSQAITAADTGLWKYPEETGTSYYFRGSKELLDNNVIFAGFQWKIIRIDKDDNIKLIYNGECRDNECAGNINSLGTDTQIGSTKFNQSVFTSEVGYTYIYGSGGANKTDSLAKVALENWYASNLLELDSYIADVVYCNDRGINSYWNATTYYNANNRINSLYSPTLDCNQVDDRYTKNFQQTIVPWNLETNGQLKQKTGLITADEVALAGMGSTTYLYSNSSFWTMTPTEISHSSTIAYVYSVSTAGSLLRADAGLTFCAIRPVIALNSNVEIISGNGSEASPYIVKTN